MIRYALRCADGHEFESWFASAEAYDTLRARGMALCAVCGSDDVEKALIALRVRTAEKKAVRAEPPETAPAPKETPQPVALSQPRNKLEAAIAEFRAKVEANSDYVGKRFVEEARSMHLGETPERAIHGEARPDEARALIEEGIPVLPLPFAPKQKTN